MESHEKDNDLKSAVTEKKQSSITAFVIGANQPTKFASQSRPTESDFKGHGRKRGNAVEYEKNKWQRI